MGIFLRLLDYYRGLLFLTTNRADVLDEAVLSRVMIKLEYPALDPQTRLSIWKTMFDLAELQVEHSDTEELAQVDLNGRQIRNITRLAGILYPDRSIDRQALEEALYFASGKSLPKR